MSKFIPFTDEELYQAHHKDIKEYLESIGEKVLHSGTEYMWEAHDSVKIRDHIWYRHSTGESGTAVNFLMTFFDFSFQEAVITLLDGNYKATSNSKPVDFINEPDIYHKKDRVVLPQKNTNNKRLYAYLCNSRCIDYSVVRYFVKKGFIYEDKSNHNIVFLGKDKKGIVRYAGLKGTLTVKSFKGEITGSNKIYCFKHIGLSDVLFVFEAFIDLFSFITLYQLDENWHTYNYIALGGLNLEALKKCVEDYPHIKKIYICTDNDINSSDGKNHGQDFAKKAQKLFQVKYKTEIITPNLKDWNEILKQRSQSYGK